MRPKSVIFSFFSTATHPMYLALQRRVVDKMRPPDVPFLQIAAGRSHAESIDDFLAGAVWDQYLLLDIDCIPLRPDAVQNALAAAAAGRVHGCAQRANHIENGQHVYAGPCALAFSRATWLAVGAPSFKETTRGDTAEELTYACEKHGVAVEKLWPTDVEEPLWDLTDGRRFGIGTTFGDAFYHVFFSRNGTINDSFRRKCLAVCPEIGRFRLPYEIEMPVVEAVARRARSVARRVLSTLRSAG